MLRHTRLTHRFVRHIPETLKPGIIYISMVFSTAAHKCCCGCGEEVVTPFTPNDWELTFNGETISISPSIGNWNFTCRSHYFIERGRVTEARPQKDERIETGRRRDRDTNAQLYGATTHVEDGKSAPVLSPPDGQVVGFWSWIKSWNSKTKQ